VNVNFNALSTANAPPGAAPATGSTVVLNLFTNVVFTAVLDHVERANPPSGYIWIGHVLGAGHSQVTLVVAEGMLTGQITVGGQMYQVRPLTNGVHVIYEIDQSKFQPD
jgi:hypothetical protein